jgi:hypothetical protein
MKYARENRLEFAKSDPASLVKTLAEQEDTLRVTKPAKTGAGKAADPANQENLDRVRRIKTKVLKEMEAQLGGVEEEAAPAPTLSPEQKKFMELPGAAAGTGEEIDKRALVEQARREAKGDKAKAFELYKAALAKAQGGNEEGVLEEVSRGKSELSQKEDSAPVAEKGASEAAALSNKEKTSSRTDGPRIKEGAKPTKFGPEEKPEVEAGEKDVRAKFFPPVRRSDETFEEFNQKFEQWVNDNPWYRALHEAITPRTKESSLLPPVRKANETPGAHNARFERWRKDNPLMRFFEGLKSEPGSKPGKKWDAVVKKS